MLISSIVLRENSMNDQHAANIGILLQVMMLVLSIVDLIDLIIEFAQWFDDCWRSCTWLLNFLNKAITRELTVSHLLLMLVHCWKLKYFNVVSHNFVDCWKITVVDVWRSHSCSLLKSYCLKANHVHPLSTIECLKILDNWQRVVQNLSKWSCSSLFPFAKFYMSKY